MSQVALPRRSEAMTQSEWLSCTDPTPMLEALRGNASERKLRLFACACCRRIWNLLEDKRSRKAVEVAEAFCKGTATDVELEANRDKAHEAFYPVSGADVENATFWAAAFVADGPAFFVAQHVAAFVCEAVVNVASEGPALANLLRDVFGDTFRAPPALPPCVSTWNGGIVLRLAEAVYEDRVLRAGTFRADRVAVLADALEEAGCQEASVLTHLRDQGSHWRGCWVVDWLLAKG
jgi:hypothetical protein